eukprot:TRINITY_DN13002_c0_g3_i1.p1 TRINITY_DN13002_c0_g3~~TRINITY_DN13002_c0_g3_i1.p1  ORF type:complete len:1318 (-),score=268.39 TRINITY_DN13002_c0_g3_i1:169-4122(-)
MAEACRSLRLRPWRASSSMLGILVALACCPLRCLAQKAGFCHLFYTNAETSLEKYQLEDLDEILKVNPIGYTALMYIDRTKSGTALSGYHEAMKHLYGANGGPVTAKIDAAFYAKMNQREGQSVWEIQKDVGEVDSMAEQTVVDFVMWAWTQCPPNTFRVISLSMHGAGLMGMGTDQSAGFTHMSVLKIRSTFQTLQAKGVRFDVIGFDQCLMSAFSVAKALAGLGDYLLASEPLEPGYGWDYTKIDTQALDAVAYGTSIIDGMHAQNSGPNQLALTDLTKFQAVLPPFQALVSKLTSGLRAGDEVLLRALERARENSAEYPSTWEIFADSYSIRADSGLQERSAMDFGSFWRNLEPQCPGIAGEIEQLLKAFSTAVVYKKIGSGHAVECTGPDCAMGSTGIHLFFKKRRWMMGAYLSLAQSQGLSIEDTIRNRGVFTDLAMEKAARETLPEWYQFLNAYYTFDADVASKPAPQCDSFQGDTCFFQDCSECSQSTCQDVKIFYGLVPGGKLCVCEEPLCAVNGQCVDLNDVQHLQHAVGLCGGSQAGGERSQAMQHQPPKSLVTCQDFRAADGQQFCSSTSLVTNTVNNETTQMLVNIPSNGGDYPPNAYALFHVAGPATLTWSRFDLEYSHGCKYDYVMVSDRKYCGVSTPPRIVVPIHGLKLVFNSDSEGSGKGVAFTVESRNASALEEDAANQMESPSIREYCSFGRNSCTSDPSCGCPEGFVRNTFVQSGPTVAGLSEEIQGSDHWLSCFKADMHVCGDHCCCDTGYVYTRAQRCEANFLVSTCYACDELTVSLDQLSEGVKTRGVGNAERGDELSLSAGMSPCAPGSPFCGMRSDVLQNGDVLLSGFIDSSVTAVDFYVGVPAQKVGVPTQNGTRLPANASWNVSWLLQLPTHIINSTSVEARWPRVVPRVQGAAHSCSAFIRISGAVDGFTDVAACSAALVSAEAPVFYYADEEALENNRFTPAWLVQDVACGSFAPIGETRLRAPNRNIVEGMLVPKSAGGFVQPVVFAGANQTNWEGSSEVACDSGGAMPWDQDVSIVFDKWEDGGLAQGTGPQEVFGVFQSAESVLRLSDLLTPQEKARQFRSVSFELKRSQQAGNTSGVDVEAERGSTDPVTIVNDGVRTCAPGSSIFEHLFRSAFVGSLVLTFLLVCCCTSCAVGRRLYKKRTAPDSDSDSDEESEAVARETKGQGLDVPVFVPGEEVQFLHRGRWTDCRIVGYSADGALFVDVPEPGGTWARRRLHPKGHGLHLKKKPGQDTGAFFQRQGVYQGAERTPMLAPPPPQQAQGGLANLGLAPVLPAGARQVRMTPGR